MLSILLYILLGIVVFFILLFVGFKIMCKIKNKRLEPDYYEIYKQQDTVPTGKVGLFITGLIVTEKMSHTFFFNITKKIFNTIIPWPFRLFSYMDKGVALLDEVKYHEHHEFTPTKLVDPYGNDRYIDGEPYIEKYKRGEVQWVEPSKRIWLDHGYFLYTECKAGIPSLTGKTMNRANLWYYDKGIKQKKMPHEEGTMDIVNGAIAKVREKYSDIPCEAENSMFYHEMRMKLHKLLDDGCETIVLSAPMAIYSHFEEFNSSFRHCFEYIEEWEQKHNKKIKVIMAPPFGHFQPARQAWLDMLKDRLDSIPEGSDVMVAVTVHGMPWDHFAWEAWLELAPPYRDTLTEEVKELVASYTFNRTDVQVCQDEFANPIWDPKEKYLSTNMVYKKGIKEGYDYVIGLPIEFFAENSDTLYHHAMQNYHGIEGYDVYEVLDYPDWSVPYVKEMKQGKTHVIYNGVPVGKYQPNVIEALFQSIDEILKKKK